MFRSRARRLAIAVAGAWLGVGMAFAPAVGASTTVNIERAFIQGSVSTNIVVLLAYSCDPPRPLGVSRLSVITNQGFVSTTPQGDGRTHTAAVHLYTTSITPWRSGRVILVTANIVDVSPYVALATQTKVLTVGSCNKPPC
jgi:hypothetical protein